jgi:hypothetical protein
MSDEEFDDTGDLDLDDEDLVEDELDEDLDEDTDGVDVLDDDIDAVVVDVEAVVAPATSNRRAVVTPAAAEEEDEDEEDDDVVDLDEELHPDDVEEPLDVLLQERTASATLEDDEEELEEEEVDLDDRGEGPTRIVPRRPGEFLCSSCFLVLPRNQLADEPRMLCRDCA